MRYSAFKPAERDVDPTVRLEVRNDGSVYRDGRPLQPRDVAAALLRRAAPLQAQTLYIVASPILGRGMRELAQRIDPQSAIVAVEFDHDVARVTRSLRAGDPTDPVVYFDRDSALAAIRGEVERRGIRRVRELSASRAAAGYATGYRELACAATAIIRRHWSNRATELVLGRRWLRNLVRNLVLPCRQPAQLDAGLAARPMILVGAGPSLELALDEIARQRQVCSVVAIDTALPRLAAAGIQPDLIVSLDAQLANARDFTPWRWQECSILYDMTVHTSVPRRFAPERRFAFVTRFRDLALFDNRVLFAATALLPPLGSVAPTALYAVACFVRPVAILTVGIDFWYHAPLTHARGTAPAQHIDRIRDRLRARDGNDAVLARPMVDVALRDGAGHAAGDAVLAAQALHMRDTVRRVVDQGCRVFHLRSCGLDLGTIGCASVADYVTEAQRRGTPTRRHQAGSDTGGLDVQRRRRALIELGARVDAQIEALAHHSRAFDAGLDFALLTLPQWPALTLRQEWWLLHRGTVQRSLLDYRNAIERALTAAFV